MSTRAQVRVIEAGLPWNTEDHNTLMLYHHCDGYPTNMLKLILDGYEKAITPMKIGDHEYDKSWQAGRSGKAAAYIISTDPGGFEPESGNEFHGDIEWFYEIVTVNHANTGGAPTWAVRVFSTLAGFWDSPDREHLAEIASGDILELYRNAQAIEDRLDDVLATAKPRKQRKQPSIATLVYNFVTGSAQFTAQELREYVSYRTKSTKAPSSPDRVMRDLRKEGKINYQVVNRTKSLYRTLPVENQAAQ